MSEILYPTKFVIEPFFLRKTEKQNITPVLSEERDKCYHENDKRMKGK